jgi:hypothetical protein
MAMNPAATKRQKELARRQKKREKAERKAQRQQEKQEQREQLDLEPGQDPDLVGIVPGPQAREDEELPVEYDFDPTAV